VSLFHRKLENLHDNIQLPIFEQRVHNYTGREIAEILLDPDLSSNNIATSHPVSVQNNMVFVVDLSNLEKPEDVHADDLGSWICNGKRCANCEVEDGHVLEVDTGSSVQANSFSGVIINMLRQGIFGGLYGKAP